MEIDSIWNLKYRPKTIEDIILPKDVKKYFEDIKKTQNKDIPHIMLASPQGQGKTTLALIIVNDVLNCQYIYINGSEENGIEILRNKILSFIETKSIDGNIKIVILDEASGLTSTMQNGLKNVMEEYSKYARFIFCCNEPNKIIAPIHSRCIRFDVLPDNESILKRCLYILKTEQITTTKEELSRAVGLIKRFSPDIRQVLNYLQRYSKTGELLITAEDNLLEYYKEIYTRIINKENLLDIRKYIIQNELKFGSQYDELLKGLFNCFYNNVEFPLDLKKQVMLTIIESLKDHVYVLDKELNFFGCLIKLSKVLE